MEASDGEAGADSELTLEIFIIFAIELEELGPDMTGAGGKGNIVVLVEILEVRGETDSDECDEVLSDGVKLATFLGLISALISLLALLTCPLV